jgi:hypothetical protein
VLAPGANLDVDVRAASLADAESGAEQRSLKVTPRLVWRLADQVNVFGTYELTEVNDVTETTVTPIVFAREGTAQRWSITPNIRISKVIGIFATYSGRNERVFTGERVIEHEFRLETRATSDAEPPLDSRTGVVRAHRGRVRGAGGKRGAGATARVARAGLPGAPDRKCDRALARPRVSRRPRRTGAARRVRRRGFPLRRDQRKAGDGRILHGGGG